MRSVHEILWDRALEQSADYVEQYLTEVLVYKNANQMWNYTIQQLSENSSGVCLEFGVCTGASINYFSNYLPGFTFYGFDSFEGLAEDWIGHHRQKGSFNLNGVFPKVNPNVILIKGWFDITLPKFVNEKLSGEKLAFLHVDSDTYEAAVIVLNGLRDYIKPGLFIIFDEYLGYPNWRNGEFLAWKEFCEANGVKYRYRGFCTEQALVEII